MQRSRIRWESPPRLLVLGGLGTLVGVPVLRLAQPVARRARHASAASSDARDELTRVAGRAERQPEETARSTSMRPPPPNSNSRKRLPGRARSRAEGHRGQGLRRPAHRPGAHPARRPEQVADRDAPPRRGRRGRRRWKSSSRTRRTRNCFRQTHDKPVGAATLELPTAFWEKVKPGTDLFLEVVAYTDDDRKSVLAERLPLARPVYVTHLVTDKPLYKPGETIRFRSLTLDRSTLRPPAHDLHLMFRLRDPGDAVVPLDEGNGRLLARPATGARAGQEAAARHRRRRVHALRRSARRRVQARSLRSERRAPAGSAARDAEVHREPLRAGHLREEAGVRRQELRAGRRRAGAHRSVAHRRRADEGREGQRRRHRRRPRRFHEQKDATFTIVTDASGTKAVLDVRFKLPADLFEKATKDAPPSATLSVNIQDGSDAEPIVRPIPLVTKNLQVEFFPEGGEMIEGVPGRVYFMVRTPTGKPADLKGYITDGTNTIAEVATLTDAENPGVNRGHGVFTLTPKAGQEVLPQARRRRPASPSRRRTASRCPTAKADGVALDRARRGHREGRRDPRAAAVAQGHEDAARRRVCPRPAHRAPEARRRGRTSRSKSSLKGDDAAGGVTRVTVFEEPKGDGPGRAQLIPRAERLVFRKPGEQLVLNANPDKPRYTPAGKVRLDLSAFNEKEQPTPAVLLVGVVNRSVITMADNKTDRLHADALPAVGRSEAPGGTRTRGLPADRSPEGRASRSTCLLGTQGWRRFAEQNVAPANPADKPDVDQMLVAHGQRTTAPFELFKLEEQRVSAEFRPKLEQARLRRAAAAERGRDRAPRRPRRPSSQIAQRAAVAADEAVQSRRGGRPVPATRRGSTQPASWGLPVCSSALLRRWASAGSALRRDAPSGSRRPYSPRYGRAVRPGRADRRRRDR